MKLNASQPRKVEGQLGGEAIPDQLSYAPWLKRMFGDRTIQLDAAGLKIF